MGGTNDNGQETNVTIVPNPFSETTTITISDNVDLKNTTIDIYNILGMKVKSLAVTQSSLTLNKENLQPGVYMLRLNSNNATKFTSRFVVR